MASGMASGFELGMALDMALVRSEMVTVMVSELEKAFGLPSETKLIGHVCFEEICNV